MHLTSGALGDEQLFDIELDRYTQLLPMRENRIPSTWDSDDVISPAPTQQSPIKSSNQNASSEFGQYTLKSSQTSQCQS